MSLAPLKVAYVDHTTEAGGGAEEALVDILRFVNRQLVEPWLIVARRTDWLRDVDVPARQIVRFFAEHEQILKLSRDTLGHLGRNIRNIPAGIRLVWRLARLLQRFQIDIVHTNTLKTHILGGLAAWLARKPVVWDVRDILEPGPAQQLLFRVARITHPHIVAMSAAVARSMEGAKCPITIVHGGRCPDDFPQLAPQPEWRAAFGLQPQQDVITIVARLTPWKGHRVLLQAFQQVHMQRPQARLLIVGAPTFWEESYLYELQEYAATLGCAEAVIWAGYRRDIPQILAITDVFVLPSFNEPFGIVLVEAMLAGKPVIACDSGGPPEIVEHRKTGFIIPTGQAAPLANALLELLENRNLAQQLGQHGRKRAIEYFDIRRSISRIEALYQELLSRH